MDNFSATVVRRRKLVLIMSVLLLIPSLFGILGTRINYDMLTYLPADLDTVIGQDILLDDYGKGAFSMIIIEEKTPDEVVALKREIEQIDHVDAAVWYDNVLSTDVPMEILPDKYYDAFNRGQGTLMAVFFDTSTSADETITAVGQIRNLVGENGYVTGMSALVKDLKDLCEREEPHYVALAVVCAVAAMMVFLDSWIIPLIFLASIGMAIVYNLGSNIFMGEISYITKALSAVLQLAVTMDYSIFLWHSYEEECTLKESKEVAMEAAIKHTFISVLGSSITTVAGFIALCFMSFTLGKDLGIVMAKGVIFGVIGCVTTLPALILCLDKVIQKTRHKAILPKGTKLADFVVKKSGILIAIFLLVLGPAVYGYNHTNIYYDMAGALPADMNFVISNEKLMDEYGLGTTHMLLVDSKMEKCDAVKMTEQLKQIDGVKTVIGLDSLCGKRIPDEILPDKAVKVLKRGDRQLLLVMSEYRTASRQVNRQLTEMNQVMKAYDNQSMIIGEAACTKDLMQTTDRDFKLVSGISVVLIFLIIAVVLKSASLPILLVATIYFAIFINLGIPYYTDTWLAFIAPICLSTIQLGATVDYAILLTNRYKRERLHGIAKEEAIRTAVSASTSSIVVSAIGFFAATFGVYLYSELDMISSMCGLMARGALISMVAVIFILPPLLKVFDRVIIKTTTDMRLEELA